MSLNFRMYYVLLAILALSVAYSGEQQQQAATSRHSGTGIDYTVHGSGQPVVLVHGFSQTRKMWFQTPLYRDLTANYKVIAVDLPGHGDSDKPHEPTAYGRNIEAALVELLDHLGIDKAHFVGFSMGASIVAGMLTSSPDRVQTATLGSGLFTTWSPEEEEFANFTEMREQTGERYPWEPENQDFKALAAVIRGAQFAVVSKEEIAAIDTPTLVVFGSIEVDQMTEAQKLRLNDLPASMETLIVDGADHDSAKAAILSTEFSRAVQQLIRSNPIQY